MTIDAAREAATARREHLAKIPFVAREAADHQVSADDRVAHALEDIAAQLGQIRETLNVIADRAAGEKFEFRDF